MSGLSSRDARLRRDDIAALPSKELDDLLVAGGEATWAAGPLRKGSNLCHGAGGNGYTSFSCQSPWL